LLYIVIMRMLRALCTLVLPIAVLTLLRDARGSDTDWHKVTTRHFELYTDLDEETAVEAAKELEKTRDALITAAWPAFAFPDVVRTQVFVLSNGLDFERFLGRRLWGLFVPGTRPAFYLYGPPSRWSPRATMNQVAPSSVLRHEMTHQLAAAVFRRAPRWFKEGLAQFLETVQITPDSKSIVVGRTNRDARAKFYADRTVTLKRTLEWSEPIADLAENEVHALYGTSWAFFYWLYNNRQQPFSRYQLALAKGFSSKKAWDAAFPGFNPDVYDTILYDYSVHGQAAVDTLPLRTSAPSIDVKAMSAADAHGVRARIAFIGASMVKEDERKGRLSEANAELKKALALDPTCVEALLLATSRESETLLDAVRAAAKAHPEDSRIHALLGDLLNDRDEREAAYRRAVQIDHDDPQVLDSLAKLLLGLRRADEAFPLALRATMRAPHDFNVMATFAETLFQRGRCHDAVEQQQLAADRASEAETSAAPILQRLEIMKAACKTSGASSGADRDSSIANDDGSLVGDSQPATPDGPKIRPHYEGIFASGSVGLGYGYGSYESTRLATERSAFDGGGLDIAGAIGYGFARGFVLALEVGLFSHPAFSEQVDFRPSGAFVTDVTTVRFGLLTDFHPFEKAPFHLQAGFGLVRASWNGSPGAPHYPQLPIDEISIGYFSHASAGLVWRVHHYELGPSLRVHYASLGSEHIDANLYGFTAVMGFFL
jgi:tetratricopeptide (TPR) repeat protein